MPCYPISRLQKNGWLWMKSYGSCLRRQAGAFWISLRMKDLFLIKAAHCCSVNSSLCSVGKQVFKMVPRGRRTKTWLKDVHDDHQHLQSFYQPYSPSGGGFCPSLETLLSSKRLQLCEHVESIAIKRTDNWIRSVFTATTAINITLPRPRRNA